MATLRVKKSRSAKNTTISQLHHKHGLCRDPAALGRNYDCMATLAAMRRLLRGFGAAMGRPSGGRLEFAAFSVKSMPDDDEGLYQ
jgi:hypothetical protein